MAHELDITDGTASFASAKQDAWHRLGTVLEDVMTAQEALDAAHLSGWDVRKVPLFMHPQPVLTETGVTSPEPVEVPDRFATVRTNPINQATDYLGVVGPAYTPIQNEEHTELMDAFVGESGAHFETAGALRGGRETFVTMKMPEAMKLSYQGGNDPVDLYIAALNSHDGSSAFRFMVTPVRIVCANTQAAAISRAKSTFSIRHTSGASNYVNEARQALGIATEYFAKFEEAAQTLIDTPMDFAESAEFFRQLTGLNEKGISDRTKGTRQRLHQGLTATLAQTITLDDALRQTRWGAYNAVTEWFDHHAPVRGAEGDAAADARALRALTASDTTKVKQRAFDLLVTA